MCKNRVPPHPSQFGKSRLLAEMTKPRRTRISLSILVLVWKMNQDGAELRSWAYICETHKCCHQHKTHETRNGKAGQGWAVPPKKDGLSAACQENSSSCILFSAAIFPGGLLRPSQKVSRVGQGTRSLFTTVWLKSSSQTLLCKKVLLPQLASSDTPS